MQPPSSGAGTRPTVTIRPCPSQRRPVLPAVNRAETVGSELDRPRLVLTSDQDWAPEWAIEELVRVAAGWDAPLHVFRTNPTPVLDSTSQLIEVTHGWHPNFGAGSSHGSTPEAVIRYCEQHFGGCASVRSHGLIESSAIWRLLAGQGVRFDSQTVTRFQPRLGPLAHWTGIVRLPVWFEDDVWLRVAHSSADTGRLVHLLLTPGLKIFNVHAALLATNCPSIDWYDRHRRQLYGPDPQPIRYGRHGVAETLNRLVDGARDAGLRFESWDRVAADSAAALASMTWPGHR